MDIVCLEKVRGSLSTFQSTGSHPLWEIVPLWTLMLLALWSCTFWASERWTTNLWSLCISPPKEFCNSTQNWFTSISFGGIQVSKAQLTETLLILFGDRTFLKVQFKKSFLLLHLPFSFYWLIGGLCFIWGSFFFPRNESSREELFLFLFCFQKALSWVSPVEVRDSVLQSKESSRGCLTFLFSPKVSKAGKKCPMAFPPNQNLTVNPKYRRQIP